MNRLQANLCLVCVTLFWAAEVIIYACIPEGVPEFATMSVAFAQVLNMFAIRRVPADDATVVYSMKLVFTLLLGLLIPAGIITKIELTPPVIVGATFVMAGSLAKMVDFGAIRRLVR